MFMELGLSMYDSILIVVAFQFLLGYIGERMNLINGDAQDDV
jgi:hypothetical protein